MHRRRTAAATTTILLLLLLTLLRAWQANGAGGGTRLGHYGPLRTTDRYLQDGEVHVVKIVYTPGKELVVKIVYTPGKELVL